MAKAQTDKKQRPAVAGVALSGAPERDDETRRDSYRVKLEIFEGPLDLLLYLIRKDEIDIYDIPIAHITEQYLAYLELMQELDISVAGDFLVMASTLIYIKSKTLLPPDPKVEGEEDLSEDPRAELMERLLEYQKFKSASQMLYSRGEIESACYSRGPLETDSNNPEVSATVLDLLRVFREVLKRAEAQIEMEIARDEVTIAEKLAQIHAMLDQYEQINVREIFEMSRSKRELIITFLALLELVKEWAIYLIQRELFGDIFARKRTESPLEIQQEPVEQSVEEQAVEATDSQGVEERPVEATDSQGVEEQTVESMDGQGVEKLRYE
ncbi:MAG TPA: segregation/condensation protein A [Blastocatellia bacterium]|nr:segregation/condensation protein A [Blastocatellia bacterium]